jgi:hypothetical protein
MAKSVPRSPQNTFDHFYGVDFSGARLAGANMWIARLVRRKSCYELADLNRVADLCGCADRDPAMRFLVDEVLHSENAIWGMDFPFGLPIEIMPTGSTWTDQLAWVAEHPGGAYELGEECVRRSVALRNTMHIRRETDTQAKAPFDCYHYRIIYQTYHGMRDVLLPLSRKRAVAIIPFQYRRLPRARRVVVEACPSSTLKRLALPHQNYKQPTGGPLTAKRLRTRRTLLDAVARRVRISAQHRRTIMRNPGGDALDAVIAALGAAESFRDADHPTISRHPRYPLEGYLYV